MGVSACFMRVCVLGGHSRHVGGAHNTVRDGHRGISCRITRVTHSHEPARRVAGKLTACACAARIAGEARALARGAARARDINGGGRTNDARQA